MLMFNQKKFLRKIENSYLNTFYVNVQLIAVVLGLAYFCNLNTFYVNVQPKFNIHQKSIAENLNTFYVNVQHL